jgi:hypothetical protein
MFRFAVLCLFALGLGVSLASAEEKFMSEKGKYLVAFLKTPAESEKEIDTPIGKLAVHTVAVEVKKDLGLIVIHVDYPDAVKKQKAQEVLARTRDGSKGPNDKILEDKEITLNDKVPGREFILVKDDVIYYRARVYLDGVRLYQVIVSGTKKDDVLSPIADKFLDSFELAK